MKPLISALTLVLVCLSTTLYAQRCPSSTRTIKVFVPNESKATDLRYELIPIRLEGASPREAYDHMMKSLRLDPFLVGRTIAGEGAAEVHPELAEPFLKAYDPARYESKEGLLGNRISGEIRSGTLILKISDLVVSMYYMLRITSDEFRTGYYVGNLLGGCNQIDRLLLEWPKKTTGK